MVYLQNMEDKPEIPEFYAHKKVFITGATGFIGKVLIWKLLQCCPLIDSIYILLRSKNYKNIEVRRKELLEVPIFDNFKENNPEILNKIVAIHGDIGEVNLGLSDEDKNFLINEISIVFHGAALLKMDASIKQAINVNTKGLIRMLDITKEMKKLITFVYISTAYSCCDESEVEEKLYFVNENPHDIIHSAMWLPSKILDKITQDLIFPLPNTYTFSKRLTEHIISDYGSKLPVIIARPTIVINSLKEPIPGWIDNLNGAVGIAVTTGKGVLHSINCDPDKIGDLVPVDIICNALIACVWAENKKENSFRQIRIYNLASTETEKISWRTFQQLCTKYSIQYPFEVSLWYPTYDCIQKNKYIHKFSVIFYHWIPAYIIDFVMLLCGKKQFMIRVQKKVVNGLKVLNYFTMKQWTFKTDNILQLKNLMNEADKKMFPVTLKNINLEEWTKDSVLGTKRFLFKENLDNLSLCKRRLKMLYVASITMKFILYAVLINVLFRIINFIYNITIIV